MQTCLKDKKKKTYKTKGIKKASRNQLNNLMYLILLLANRENINRE